MNKFFLVGLLTISFVACTPQSSAPTAVSLPISPTSTATFILTGTSTPEIDPIPTSTPKIPDQTLNSPNGEFIAKFDNAYSHPAFEPQIIEILNKNGSLLWNIPYQHETEMVDPHPGMSIYKWSKDSTYLYFYYYFSPDGGDRAFWWDGFDLQRINVQDGKIEQVIPGDKESFVAFAFSHDETQFAYTRAQDNPSIIFIRNLITGAEKTANVIFSTKNYSRVGNIVWSPSDGEIAFQTETDDYIAQTIYLNLSTMKQKVVREYLVATSYFDGFSDDGNLVFLDITNGNGYKVHVNPKNGEITIIGTPTSQP